MKKIFLTLAAAVLLSASAIAQAAARYRMTQALPNTRVMVTGAATVANGWRELDNYYKMRDLLGMYYMSW